MSYWAEKGAPPKETYNHVLFRPDWNPLVAYTERNYGEIATSRCVEWPEDIAFPLRPPGRDSRWLPRAEDRSTCAMFVRSVHLRTRMKNLGWVDVTELWHPKQVKAVEPVVLPRVTVGTLGAPVAPAAPSIVGKKEAEAGAPA